ncbi:hypothetical protein B0I35DRAFT_479032 [Stachybotrys elegans]|uniref:Chromo domain-containing protein n=1 Tax=Stachybotrys elegans TaxID=80388 RepID=A0A8K0WRY7_9HYPO|nr:hypothetical protein B0I35DRAFT_479032 [Stachybotrys elegans]
MPKKRGRLKSKSKSQSRKPKPTQEEEEEIWWSIRAILDERRVEGQIEYLVDWEPHHITGETYDPTWSCEVTDEAREDWLARKKAKSIASGAVPARSPALEAPDPSRHRPVNNPAPASPAPQDSTDSAQADTDRQESQSPRPSNWRQLQSQRKRLAAEALDDQPYKRPRIVYSEAPSEETVPSIISTESTNTTSDHLGPSDQEYQPGQAPVVTVEIYQDPFFDPTEYHSAPTTQSTCLSTQSLLPLDEDPGIVLSSQRGDKIIPDSQDQSGQLWTETTQEAEPPLILDSTENQDPSQSSAQQFHETPCNGTSVSQANSSPRPSDRVPIANTSEQSTGGLTDKSPGNSLADPGVIETQHQKDSSASHVAPTLETEAGHPSSSATSKDLDIPSHQPAGSPSHTEDDGRVATINTSQARAGTQSPSHTGHFGSVLPAQLPLVLSPRIGGSCPTNKSTTSQITTVTEHTSSEPASNHGSIAPPGAPSPSNSQAAQIVPQDLDLLTQVLVNIGDTSSTSGGKPSQEASQIQRPVATSSLGASSSVVRVSSSESGPISEEAQGNTSKKPREVPPSLQSRHLSRIMEPSRSESPSRRVSAAEELRSQVNLDDLVAGLDAPLSSIENTLDMGQATNEQSTIFQSQIPILTMASGDDSSVSGLHNHSQTLDHDEPWAGSITPSSIMPQPNTAPLSEVSSSVVVPIDISASMAIPGHHHGEQPTTIAPADMTSQGFINPAVMSSIPEASPVPLIFDGSDQSITMAQLHDGHDEDLASDSHQDTPMMELVVTLPFQARARPEYDAIILKYNRDIAEFSRIFNDEDRHPEPERVKVIDDVFNQLRNVCDYPLDLVGTALENLSTEQKAKYCYDANSKFNFVYELLQQIRKEIKILVVARSATLLRLLFSVAEALGVECECTAINRSVEFPNSVVQLTLAQTSDRVDPGGYHLVIGFDHSFQRSYVWKQLRTDHVEKPPSLVLSLVATHSIDHIDLNIPDHLTDIERRASLLTSIYFARGLINDPQRGMAEVNEIADEIALYLNAEVHELLYDPVEVPQKVLDVYDQSETQTQTHSSPKASRELGLKRKLDVEDDDGTKRARTAEPGDSTLDEPVLTDEVRRLIESVSSRDTASDARGVHVSVPLAVLEALAKKVAGYEHELSMAASEQDFKNIIDNLQSRVKEYERTSRRVYERYREALQDRTKFEKEKVAASEALELAKKASKAQVDKLTARISGLEATVAQLRASAEAPGTDDRLANAEKELKEAQGNVQALERKLETARKNDDYVASQYQIATSSVTSMRAEITELQRQNEHLKDQASGNLVKIHQVQAEQSSSQFLAQINELKSIVRERELELDQRREEIRQIKSIRRETRAVSVHSSPRMGVMMSPRPGRASGGSASRGTSPVSGVDRTPAMPGGMQYIAQQPGNGRWPHLRE